MGKPSRFDGLLADMCVGLGYCGGPNHVTDFIPAHGQVTAEQFVDWVFQAEGISPLRAEPEQRRALIAIFIKHMGKAVDVSLFKRG